MSEKEIPEEENPIKKQEIRLSFEEKLEKFFKEDISEKVERFEASVDKVRQYYEMGTENNSTMNAKNDYVLECVYGSGVPDEFLFRHGGYGLDDILFPKHPFNALMRYESIGESYRHDYDFIHSAWKTLRQLCEVHEQWVEKIIAKSEDLQQLLKPINEHKDEPRFTFRSDEIILDDSDFEKACSILKLRREQNKDPDWHAGWARYPRVCKRILSFDDLQYYMRVVLPRFGKQFRSVAFDKLTKEEFEQYVKDIKEPLYNLRDAVVSSVLVNDD